MAHMQLQLEKQLKKKSPLAEIVTFSSVLSSYLLNQSAVNCLKISSAVKQYTGGCVVYIALFEKTPLRLAGCLAVSVTDWLIHGLRAC